MDRIIDIFRKNWMYLIAVGIGGLGGYLYWVTIGCSSGTCPITASPVRSVVWGAIMGVLIFNIFKKRNE